MKAEKGTGKERNKRIAAKLEVLKTLIFIKYIIDSSPYICLTSTKM